MTPTRDQIDAAVRFWTDALLSGRGFVPADSVNPTRVQRFGEHLRRLLQLQGESRFADVFHRQMLRAPEIFVLQTDGEFPVGMLNEAALASELQMEMLAFPCNVQFVLRADGSTEVR